MKLHTKLLSLVLAAALLLCLPTALRRIEEQIYPCRYAGVVEGYAAAYEMDPLLIYTFVRTESGFDPEAVSSVGARGLMQMTEETFEWIKTKIAPDEPLTFDDLFDPACAVRFGAYYLRLCLDRYGGDVATAAAAYHSGWGTVDSLLHHEDYTGDGKTLPSFPYSRGEDPPLLQTLYGALRPNVLNRARSAYDTHKNDRSSLFLIVFHFPSFFRAPDQTGGRPAAGQVRP